MADAKEEMRTQIEQLERRIRPLEWDASRNQINEHRKSQLAKLQEEYNELKKRMSELQEPRE
jgi:predicted nuclease with TOPRIM domain